MKSNSDKLIKILNHELPKEYKTFINNKGVISDSRGEVFGYSDGININKIPCVVGATSLYKNEYKNILNNELVISFDQLENTPIVLDINDGSIYSVDFNKKTKINSSFNNWLTKIIGENS